ncbi:MAG: hypothetical protein GXY32_01410 [Ruminococcaceae bacterium]|nr:hypothetical protein [Oscillospiraceae bacterium]
MVLFVINLAVLLLAFSPYLKTLFSSDSYAHIEEGNGLYYQGHLWLGRPVSYAIMAILYHLGVRVTSHQLLLKLILLVCSAAGAVIITLLFAKIKGNNDWKTLLLANMAVLLSFVNIFIQEFYYFPEAGPVFGFGLLFTALSVWFFFRRQNIIHLLLSLLFLVLSLGMYQVLVQLYICWGMCFWLMESKFTINKRVVLRFFQLAVVCIIASAITMAVLVLFQQIGIAFVSERNVSLSAVWGNLAILVLQVQGFLWGFKHFVAFNWVVPLVFLVLLALLVFVLARRKTKLVGWLMVLFTLAANYLSVFLLHAVTDSVWAVPRTLVGFFGLFTTVALILLFLQPPKGVRWCAAGAMAVFLVFSVIHIGGFGTAQRVNNAVDAQIAREVHEEVLRYEQKGGVRVEKMVVGQDASPVYTYPENIGYSYGDQNYRVWQNFWGAVAAYNLYTDSHMQVVTMSDEVYAEYFEGKNWDTFNAREQLVFVDDTLYMVAY